MQPSGEVWLREEGTRDAELVFSFPIDEELNDAVKQLPGRWFDWSRKHWRVPADPRNGPAVTSILARFPRLVPREDVLAWLSDSGKWRGLVSLAARDGAGFFVVRTMSGDRPEELEGARRTESGLDLLPLDAERRGPPGRGRGRPGRRPRARGAARDPRRAHPRAGHARPRAGRPERAAGRSPPGLGPVTRRGVPQAARVPPVRAPGPVLRPRPLVEVRRAGGSRAGGGAPGVRGRASVGRAGAGRARADRRAAGRARPGGGHGDALVCGGCRAGHRARRGAPPLPARGRVLRPRAPSHFHRRRAGSRQDRSGARHARGRPGVPGRGGVPGFDEAHVGARGQHVAAGSQRGAAERAPGRVVTARPWRPRSWC